MKLLLDTCTFLWAVDGSDRLSARARSLYVSPDETRKENEKLCRARREAVRKYLAR